MADVPFKNLTDTGRNANSFEQTKTIPSKIPLEGNPSKNEEREDVVPMSSPSIPWPAAPGVAQKPMKLG